MNAQEGRPSSHEVGARQSRRTTSHTTTARAFTHGHRLATAPQHRRWSRKARFTSSDAAAWALFTLIVGVILIVACVVLTLGWPS